MPARSYVSWLRVAVLAVPVVVLVWMAWRHRWTTDDAFINFRVVRQIWAGHGPVFNAGERVEVGTSPLWIAALAVLDALLPLRLEWIALLGSLAASAGAVALAIVATRRLVTRHAAAGALLVPLGALVYVVLPPAWDFATSGLECGLALLWLASCWWILVRSVLGQPRDLSPAWWAPVVLGLGPIVRPDFAVFSVAWFVAYLVIERLRGTAALRAAALGLVIPVAVEVFRVAFYGVLVPNTALAKEPGIPNLSQGLAYLGDLFGPYRLVLPLALLAGGFLVPLLRRHGEGDGPVRVAVLGALAGAAVHATFIVFAGGDFMHGRFLLPAMFTALLPVGVVAVDGWRWAVAGAVVLWAVVCGLWWRPPYSRADPSPDVAISADGIADERLYWTRSAGVDHPVTIDDYAAEPRARLAAGAAELAERGGRGLVVEGFNDARTPFAVRDDGPPVVAMAGPLGVFGYRAGRDVYAVDMFGLATALGSHQRLDVRSRPGHEKLTSIEWVLARFGPPNAAPPGVDRERLEAARRALSCGRLADLVEMSEDPWGPGAAARNFARATWTWRFRYPPDPLEASRVLCGAG